MSHSVTEITVGGVVLAAAVAFGIYATQTTSLGAGGGGSYELSASFRSLEGVNVGTDVRLAGVKVGTVTGMELDPETYRAVTTFSVTDKIEIPDDSAVVVSSEGLLGGNFVEIMPGGSPFFFEAGDQVSDTQGAVSLISLLVKFVTASGSSE